VEEPQHKQTSTTDQDEQKYKDEFLRLTVIDTRLLVTALSYLVELAERR